MSDDGKNKVIKGRKNLGALIDTINTNTKIVFADYDILKSATLISDILSIIV